MIIDTLSEEQTRTYYESLPIGPPLLGIFDGAVHHVPWPARIGIAQIWKGKVFINNQDVVNRVTRFLTVKGDVWRTMNETIIDYPHLGMRDTIRYSGDFYLGRLVLPFDQFLWFTLRRPVVPL